MVLPREASISWVDRSVQIGLPGSQAAASYREVYLKGDSLLVTSICSLLKILGMSRT